MNSLRYTLTTPLRGLRSRIQAIGRSIPGIASGSSIIVHAQLRPGMSVRSTSQAKMVDNTRLMALTTTA